MESREFNRPLSRAGLSLSCLQQEKPHRRISRAPMRSIGCEVSKRLRAGASTSVPITQSRERNAKASLLRIPVDEKQDDNAPRTRRVSIDRWRPGAIRLNVLTKSAKAPSMMFGTQKRHPPRRSIAEEDRDSPRALTSNGNTPRRLFSV